MSPASVRRATAAEWRSYLYQHIIEFIDREIERLQQARSILVGTKSLPYDPGRLMFTETNTPIPPNGLQIDQTSQPTKGRKRWSEEARKAHSERLRARWRKRKADAIKAEKKNLKK